MVDAILEAAEQPVVNNVCADVRADRCRFSGGKPDLSGTRRRAQYLPFCDRSRSGQIIGRSPRRTTRPF
jgi:hypothetical protein